MGSVFLLSWAPASPGIGTGAGAVWWPHLLIFAVGFAGAFALTPLLRYLARRWGIVDKPDGIRKCHRQPIAYLGGIAIFLGWLLALGAAYFLRARWIGDSSTPVIRVGILFGAGLMVFMGAWDDVHKIGPWTRIGGEILAAIALLYDGIGLAVTQRAFDALAGGLHAWTGFPAGPNPAFPHWLIVATSAAFVICAVIGCCNATNLIDGLDGLCSGVTAIICAGLLFLAVHLTLADGSGIHWNYLRMVLAVAVFGAVLGFLPFNFNPATIFMGDAGSLFLGFNCAALITLLGQEQHPKWVLAGMVVYALPALDTLMAIARRKIKGRPMFASDRCHFHHQLLARGLSVPKAVFVCYLLSVAFAMLGALIIVLPIEYAGPIWLLTLLLVTVAAYKLGMIHERTPAAPEPVTVPDGGEDLTPLGLPGQG